MGREREELDHPRTLIPKSSPLPRAREPQRFRVPDPSRLALMTRYRVPGLLIIIKLFPSAFGNAAISGSFRSFACRYRGPPDLYYPRSRIILIYIYLHLYDPLLPCVCYPPKKRNNRYARTQLPVIPIYALLIYLNGLGLLFSR